MSTTPNTEKVLAGEVCSIDTAKHYGFFDTQNYYNNKYSKTKTYSAIDTPDRTYKLCNQTGDGSIAHPLCPIVYGVPYEQDKDNANQCIISTCPPGFTKDGNKCTKPILETTSTSMIAQSTRCDEKPTDWYMIPNYHLGNKFHFVSDGSNQTCMKPCPAGRIPGYVQDPVDGSSAGVLANATLDQCYTKPEYMSGKYVQSGNFCPIAWVYRLGQTKEAINSNLVQPINAKKNQNGDNIYLDIGVTLADEASDEVLDKGKTLLENVDLSSGSVLTACSKLHTQERIKTAYDICKSVHDSVSADNTTTNKKKKTDISKIIKKIIKYFLIAIIILIIILAFTSIKNRAIYILALLFITIVLIIILQLIAFLLEKKNQVRIKDTEDDFDFDDDGTDPTQKQVLRQACHALFCNKNDDTAARITPGTKGLCFPKDSIAKIPDLDLFKNDEKIENQDVPIETEDEPKIEQNKKLRRGVYIAKILIFIGLGIAIGIPAFFMLMSLFKWMWLHIFKRSSCALTYGLDLVTFKYAPTRDQEFENCTREIAKEIAIETKAS